jgi:hypothetical protein
VKSVPAEQLSQQILSYNDAVLKWESDFGLYSIRLRTLFPNEETLKQWESIKARRDDLDVAIYELTSGTQKSTKSVNTLLETISDLTVGFSRDMIAEIKAMRNGSPVSNQRRGNRTLPEIARPPRRSH